MKKRIKLFLIIMYVISSSGIFAKRLAPKPVKPIVIGNIMYTAIHNDMGYIQAWDIKSSKMLWKKKIYSVFIKPLLEKDVQDIYIRDMKMLEKNILILNEKNQIFLFNPSSKSVAKLKFESYSNYFEASIKYTASQGFFEDSDNYVIKYFSRNKNVEEVKKDFERIFTTKKCQELLILDFCIETGYYLDNCFFLYDVIEKTIINEDVIVKKTYRGTNYGTLIEITFMKKDLKGMITDQFEES